MLTKLARRVLIDELAATETEIGQLLDELAVRDEKLIAADKVVEGYRADAHAMQALTKFRPVLTLTALKQLGELAEVDSQYLELIRRLIAAEGLFAQPTEQDRLIAVQESRVLAANDPVTERILTIWTDFGFGLKLDIKSVDEAAVPVWNEFWTATRNKPILAERVIHELSDTLLKDGEFFFVFFISEDNAEVTIRIFLTDEVEKIITDPDDAVVPVYYLRRWKDEEGMIQEKYYRDWRIDPETETAAALLAAVEKDFEPTTPIAHNEVKGKDVVVMHVAFRLQSIKALRGWPLMTTGTAWVRAYKQFLENRAAVARAVATFVDKLIVKGGSTALNIMQSRFDAALDTSGRYGLTDVPEAGSTWLENEAITRQRMPLTTSAGDAQIDGGALLAQAGLAGGIPPHLLGRGEVVRMAIADAMDQPIYRQFLRYQNFWISVWQDVGIVVLEAQGFTDNDYDTGLTVQTDALINVQLADLISIMGGLEISMGLGLIDASVAQKVVIEVLRTALHIAGVQDASAVLEGVEETPPEEVPVVESAVRMNEECPLCEHMGSMMFPDHGNLRVCMGCGKTWSPELDQ